MYSRTIVGMTRLGGAANVEQTNVRIAMHVCDGPRHARRRACQPRNERAGFGDRLDWRLRSAVRRRRRRPHALLLASSNLEGSEREQRARLFGRWSDGRRPNRPYRWKLEEPAEASAGRLDLIELPVTTYPLLRTPIHLSYLIWLRRFGSAAPFLYFRGALRLCRLLRVEPSFLLHPLDFLGPTKLPSCLLPRNASRPRCEAGAGWRALGPLLGTLRSRAHARRAESWSSEPTLAERRPTS